MLNYYETIPNELARLILGDSYVEGASYQLITDVDGSYISGIDNETGERLALTDEGDDYKLEVDEFQLVEDELEDIAENDNDYSVKAFGMWSLVVALCCIAAFVSIAVMLYFLFWR